MLKKIKTIVLNTIVLILLLELVLGIFYNYKSKKEYDEYIALKVNANVHPTINENEVEDLYYEYLDLEMQWTPFTHYKPRAFKGVYNSINDLGQRKTSRYIAKDSITTSPIRIFCFGGSTMYGIGATDKTTIPSLMAELLSEKFPESTFEITNFGIPGYTRDMEYLQLVQELKQGNIPTIAIFYDGVNEVLAAYQNKKVGVPVNASNRNLEFNAQKSYKKKANLLFRSSNIKRFVRYAQRRVFKPKSTKIDYEILSKDIVSNYTNNVLISASLENIYDMKVYNFIQPTIFSKKELSDFEEVMAKNDVYLKPLYDATYTAILNDIILQRDSNYIDLQHLFDPYEHTLFTDFCHTAEKGNKIIAEEIVRHISQELLSEK